MPDLDTSLPETIPEHTYATPRAVAAGIPRPRALALLETVLARSRTVANDPLPHAERPDGFSFSWGLGEHGGLLYGSEETKHEFSLAFSEVEAVIVDFTTLGGRYGVRFRRSTAST